MHRRSLSALYLDSVFAVSVASPVARLAGCVRPPFSIDTGDENVTRHFVVHDRDIMLSVSVSSFGRCSWTSCIKYIDPLGLGSFGSPNLFVIDGI